MKRSSLSVAVAGALLAVAAACSSSGSDAPPDDTLPPHDDGSTTSAEASVPEASTDAPGDATPADAGPPAIRFIGRFDTSDPAGPKVQWPGARILARFDGTQVSVKLADTSTTGAEHGEWDVILDGTLQASPLVMTEGAMTYPLASGLAPGAHTIELWRRTEAYVSSTQLLGFDFGAGMLLPPPIPNARRIELIGDSAMLGYGIEGNGPNCSFSAATENEHKAYPALVANALAADHHDIAYSGKGVYWNYARAVDDQVFGLLYPRALPNDETSTWDFTAFSPDVVWITLGGNDWDQPNPGDPAPPYASFVAKYDALVGDVRAKHPAAHVVCAVAASLNDDYPVGYAAYTNVKNAVTQVVSTRSAAGDAKIYTFEFTRATDADLTGCEYHPNPMKHAAMAAEAIAFIKSKTGW
ncbi:MAG TPA: SGNH/GDSL hydrolase family protein [Labilithrix sp.]